MMTRRRRRFAVLVATIVVVASGASSLASSDSALPRRFDVSLRVDPSESGPLSFDVIDFERRRPRDGRAWLTHKFVIHNDGLVPVSFRDTRSARFLPSQDRRRLLVADEGCGYGFDTKTNDPVLPLCLSYYESVEIPPGGSHAWDFSVFKRLRGMSRVKRGSYRYPRTVHYQLGTTDPGKGQGEVTTVEIVYDISRSGS